MTLAPAQTTTVVWACHPARDCGQARCACRGPAAARWSLPAGSEISKNTIGGLLRQPPYGVPCSDALVRAEKARNHAGLRALQASEQRRNKVDPCSDAFGLFWA